MRLFSEFCTCPTEGCGAEHAPGRIAQIGARLAHNEAGERVMRRHCVRCGMTWDESLEGFTVFDVMPPSGA